MEHGQKKTDRRVIYTKMFLKESLLSLIKEKPVTKITPTELCRHAGINRNTFYTHYESVEALLLSIEDELYRQVQQIIDNTLRDFNTLELLEAVSHIAYVNKDICTVLLSGNSTSTLLERAIDLAHDKTVKAWKEAGIPDNPEQIEMLYTFYVSSFVAVIRRWALGGMKESTQELALFLEKATKRGLMGFMEP